MSRFNPAVLLDQAIQHLPDDKLAESVRALPDLDLANMVRQDPQLRRFVLMAVLDSLAEAGNGKASTKSRGSNKARNGKSPPPSAPHARSEAANNDDIIKKVRSVVADAGNEGILCGALAVKVGVAQHLTRERIKRLIAAGDIRKEGEGRGTRYFAA